ncbi:MAG: hypothetical protein IE878_02560 [Epsilonproteobacteria bacterium]|nr:hypothetical protein [Campylobacterota bacterium]MBD3839254.1 hypothetical protein [Campylobacterota bacterium]
MEELDNDLNQLGDELKKHIKKLVTPIKSDNELIEVLKTKLTKKEFKILHFWAFEDMSEDELFEKIKIDIQRYDELSKSLIKKINQEKFKQAIRY